MHTFYRKHKRVTFTCADDNRAKQSHAAECDIYNILKQYQRTGIVTHVSRMQPTFEDLPSDTDFQTAINMIMQAEDTFEALPAKVRDYYKNDPATFLRAFTNPSERDKLIEFGLVKPAAAPGAPAPAPEPAAS